MNDCSIMIIDDDEVDRYLLKRIIGKLEKSIEIFEADNGQVGLNFLAQYEENIKLYKGRFPPILVFLDINMPIMNGFEFLEAFSKLEDWQSKYTACVFIMYTSSERKEDLAKTQAYNFVKGYMVKGDLSSDDIENAIEEALAGQT